MAGELFRVLGPGARGVPAPAGTPEELARWAVGQLLGTKGAIVCAPRDVAALQATVLAERVSVLPPGRGTVQPGTVWVEEVEHGRVAV